MSKDIKIEILYYQTDRDIALEFGLHGNYPMRLLSSCSDSLEIFFSQLKRAVSRSEIILVVGGYSEDNRLIGFLARAIGKKCIIPNYRKLGIITEEKHIIPEDANPISPKSHLFGGFIIEHGPQTIISLVDDPKIRLDIVKELVVDYIAEHYNVFNKPFKTAESVPENQKAPADSENGEVPLEDEKITNNVSVEASVPEADEAENTEAEIQPNPVILPITFEDIDGLDLFDADESDISLTDDDDIQHTERNTDEYYCEKHKTRRVRRVVRWITAVLSVLIIAGLIAILFFKPTSKPTNSSTPEAEDYYSALQNQYSSLSDDFSKAFSSVKERESRIFTWLSLQEADINHPVLSVTDTPKSNLLTSLPDGTADVRGSLISNSNTYVTGAEYSTVIYGNATAGGLFSKLSDNSLEGKTVTTVDSRFLGEWKIFAVFTHTEAEDFDYTNQYFDSYTQHTDYLHTLASFSESPEDWIFYGNEKLLILVGVTESERYIAVALLDSIRILSTSVQSSEFSDTYSDSTQQSDISDSITSSDESYDDNDFLGETPDIYLPPLQTESRPTSSSNSTSTQNSSGTVTTPSSVPVTSSGTSSQETSAIPSQSVSASLTESAGSADSTPSSSSVPASSVTSSEPSSAASSTVSSNTSEPKPNVDPIYTWDVIIAVRSTGPDKVGQVIYGDAVTVVAYLIEIEMSPSIDPPEALIAQAIVKYNWVINNGGLCSVDQNGNVVLPSKIPTNAMQTPTKYAEQYAKAAKGMVLMYGNSLAKTYCHDTSAGFTAAYQNIWGGGSYPYLQGVECPADAESKYHGVVTRYKSEVIATLIKNSLNIDVTSMPKTEWLKPIEYDANNAYCVKISIGGIEKRGTYLRDTLLKGEGIKTINSPAYTVAYDSETDEFVITTNGWGHGVGLSQTGAKAYAKQGWTAEQILMHFFPGTTLVKN